MLKSARQIPAAVHLIGIGGSGMAALAHCLAELGTNVSGSDLHTTDETAQLIARGMRIEHGHAAKNVTGAELIVVSDAIPAHNVELAEARIRDIPVIRRAGCLNLICKSKRAVMISGAHGKSTTSAMIATVLEKAGTDPSFALGADVSILGNQRAKIAPGIHFVAEACEAFQNLPAYHPDVAVITNIDDEHLDHYGTQEKIDLAFLDFANRATTGIVANGDDVGTSRIIKKMNRPITTFGFAADNIVSADKLELAADGSRFDVRIGKKILGSVFLPVLGRHMVANALASIATAHILGIEFDQIMQGLAHFTGVRRRWEHYDTAGHIRLVDDFAHHPKEIATVADTASIFFKESHRRIIAFQPQLFSRTKRLLHEFAKELAKFDEVFLLEIDGGGEPDPGGVSSMLLANEIRKCGGIVEAFGDVDDLVRRAPHFLAANDSLITVGAGNIRTAAGRLANHYCKGETILSQRPPVILKTSNPKLKSTNQRAQTIDAPHVFSNKKTTVLSLLQQRISQYPDRIAVSDGQQSLSYSQLDTVSDRLSQFLRDSGVSYSDVIGVRLESSVELIAIVVALGKIGAIYLPLDVSLPTERANFMLGKANARFLVTAADSPFESKKNALSILELEQVRRVIAEPPPIKSLPTRRLKPLITDEDVAYICFTSGSTGKPKGIAICHGSLANFVLGVRDLFGISIETRMILNTSISFDVSIGEIWMTLCGAGELRATGSNKPLVGERLCKFIVQNVITHIAITPSVLGSLHPSPLPTLRCIISAGEVCPQALIDSWAPGRKFFNAYGPTEATIYATVALCSSEIKASIGTPLPNVTIRVLDNDLRQVEAGELCLGGAGIGSGYIDHEAETHDRFINWLAPFGKTERLYRTGDLVRQCFDGTLEYIGRIDSQIKIRGNRVELQEIEQMILQHPSVIDVAVCFEESGVAKELVCFVVLESEDEFDWASLREHLAIWLPSYMIPKTCMPVNEITLTPSGKKDRRSLLSGYRSKKIKRMEYVAPRNNVEAKLAAIWKSLLEAETDIGVYEDFEWLGGDSLKGLQLVLEIEKAFGILVPPGYFGAFSTIHRMAIQIANLSRTSDDISRATTKSFRSSRVYKQLRDVTAGWDGLRASQDAIIVSGGSVSPVYDFFLCVQTELELHSIAKHFGPSFRVHAMRSGHLIMDYTPEAINALCEHYIEELKAIRPTGKLLVGGICQGGIIALAMANLMRDRGYEIPLLILIEQSRLAHYNGEIAFFYSEDSFVNPYRRFSSGLARYDEIYGARYSVDLVPGQHGLIHTPPHVEMLAYKLEAQLQKRSIATGKMLVPSDNDQMTDLAAELAQRVNGGEKQRAKLSPETSEMQTKLSQFYAANPWLNMNHVNALSELIAKHLRRLVSPFDKALASDVLLIEHSRLFDAQFYVSKLKDKQDAVRSPARHYALHGWRMGLDPGPMFNAAGYLHRNPDVAAANINPLVHYLRHGIYESRHGWSEADLGAWQLDLIDRPDLALRETQRSSSRWPTLRRGDLVYIHAHSRGHFVFQQFQQLIGQAFQSVGVDCVLATEHPNSDERRPTMRIVVAPHDFYCLEGGPTPEAAEFLDSIPLNSEQMQSYWFAKALPFILRAPFVLDLNLQTAASLVKLGVNAKFLPLGFVPENEIFQLQKTLPREAAVRGLPPALVKPPTAIDAPWNTRAIDILLIGSNSERRKNFVAKNGRFFASKTSLIRLVNVRGALEKSNPQAISALAFAGLAQRSKILLNIHHFNTPYFEWQRLMHYGLMQGCCVVTERASQVPGLVPGEHYFEDELDKLTTLMEWLLNDKDGQERADVVRLAGYKAAVTQFQLSRTLSELFDIQ